jgi:CheY-like chemotaxis protein
LDEVRDAMSNLILLVEDSQNDALLFKRTLQRSGLGNPMVVAHDGDEAIMYLEGEGRFADRDRHPLPMIIFLDLKLPRISGFEVLEWIKNRPSLRGIPVIVLSHFGEIKEITQAYALGASSFLTKPISQTDLRNITANFGANWWYSGRNPDGPDDAIEKTSS